MFVSGEYPDEISSDDSENDDNQVDLSDLEAGYSCSGDLGGHASMSSDDNGSMDISPKYVIQCKLL